jgi:hypothetical protein
MLSRKQNSFSASSPSLPNFSSTLIAQQRLRLTSTKLRNETLKRIECLAWDLEDWEEHNDTAAKLLAAVQDFGHYIEVNQNAIPNYGDRYRHGETISTSSVESAVNQVVSKRMVKLQQMRWTKRGRTYFFKHALVHSTTTCETHFAIGIPAWNQTQRFRHPQRSPGLPRSPRLLLASMSKLHPACRPTDEFRRTSLDG